MDTFIDNPIDDEERADRMRRLNKILIMTRLDIHQQHLVADRLQTEFAGPNQIVIEEGEIGRRLYLILSGTVIVSKSNPPMDRKILAELHAGDFFGEIALLRNIPRTARITAKTMCEFLCLDAKDFFHCYERFPPSVRDDIQIIVKKRLQEQNSA